ncbi:Uncharacterized protein XB16_0359 [Leptospira santarosai]|uniref:Uncharacterized protein n=1 Tax=Leptospira santarosai TaxID=28183 RepID=A0A2P1QP71_9LEPT|nr:Uncharacterized protein XB16_0359 [Leptospira santarosai]
MNTPKKDKIQKTLKITKRVFEECWREIPEYMAKKLSAIELAEYIQRHILPVVTSKECYQPRIFNIGQIDD